MSYTVLRYPSHVSVVVSTNGNAGGVRSGSNGYFIPYFAARTTIAKITVSGSGAAFSEIGTVSSTDRKYIGGAKVGNVIYAAPFDSTTILKIDTLTDTVTEFGSIAGTGKYWGAVASGTNIYCIPHDASSVLKIDTLTDTVSTFGSLGSTAGKWAGGVLASNGNIYCVPYNSTSILKINPTTDTVSTFGSFSGSAKWAECTLHPTVSRIYCAPYNASTVLVINPSADTTSTISGFTSGTARYLGGYSYFNTNQSRNEVSLYGFTSGNRLILNVDTNAVIGTTTSSQFASSNLWGGVIFAELNNIRMVGHNSGSVLLAPSNAIIYE